MANSILTGCGKLNNNNNLYLNLIKIPTGLTTTTDLTQLVFFSHIRVNNFSDFLSVLTYYNSMGLQLLTCGGLVVFSNSGDVDKRSPVLIYYNDIKEIYVSYKRSYEFRSSRKIGSFSTTPTDWQYFTL